VDKKRWREKDKPDNCIHGAGATGAGGMGSISIIEALHAVGEEFIISTDPSPETIADCFRLRFEVYCVERNFLPGMNGLEFDEFDKNSRHVALRNRHSGELVGTVRMVMPVSGGTEHRFPMLQVCEPAHLDLLPVTSTVEISRFAISKSRRGPSASALLRLGLVQGLVRLSGELGLTHWCAVMEPSLLRLLRMTSINFVPVGPLVEYHGLRQPCYNHVGDLLDGVAAGRRDIWKYLTMDGKLWRSRTREAAIAA
jgi:N-acyl-L-homoserine lactone synthetase